MNKKISILGVGAMGGRMAQRLLDAGHELTVYNRSKERAESLVKQGARFACTPREAAEGQDIVISMVRDDVASRHVWLDAKNGALAGIGENSVALESSTVTPEWTAELSLAMIDRGVTFLDAPVVGSRPQADAGQLIYLVGGDRTGVEQIREVLLTMGSAVHHIGPVGAGMIMKLAINSLFGIQVAALAEVLAMMEKAGIAPSQAIDVLGGMPITSPALKGIGGLMVARKFAPMFPIELVEKDYGYIGAAGLYLGAELPTAAAVHQVYARASAKGLGNQNIAAVTKLFEDGTLV